MQEYKEFMNFGKELCLFILKTAEEKLKEFQINKDLASAKKLNEELITKYENLYFLFSAEVKEDEEFDEVKFLKVKKIIVDILKANNIKKEFIISEMDKREEYLGESGAEVVKKLFEYKLKEISSKRDELSVIGARFLEKQEKLQKDLVLSVQEDEGIKIMEESNNLQLNLDKVSAKIAEIQELVNELKGNLDKKWKYEIFGTISKVELRKQV